MHAASRFHRSAAAPGLAKVRAWHMHAEVLRDSAEALSLTARQRTALLRDAAAAERQARPPCRRRRPGAGAHARARTLRPMPVAMVASPVTSNAADRDVQC